MDMFIYLGLGAAFIALMFWGTYNFSKGDNTSRKERLQQAAWVAAFFLVLIAILPAVLAGIYLAELLRSSP